MSDTLDFMKKLNWFLEPISDLILFLFTSKTGFSILIILIIASIIYSVNSALRQRKLAYMAAKSYSARVPIIERLSIIVSVVGKILAKIIGNIPILLMVFIFMFFVVGLSKGISTMSEYIENQEKIKTLKSIVKQLDKRYKVAEVKVVDYDWTNDESQLDIKFFDYSQQGFVNKNQEISIKGNDIYFDAVILNFEYSEISSGNKINLALPYRVFSEDVPQEEGVRLSLTDEDGVPLIYKRNENEIYGMNSNKYYDGVAEITGYINDRDKAVKAGIRSIYGNAVHKRVKKGETFVIWVEQTGGMVIKRKNDF